MRVRRLLGLLGFVGFLLCSWFAYQCGLSARDAATRAYTLWLSDSGTRGRFQAPSRQNGLWVAAAGASLLLGLVFLSTCFYSKRTEVLRKGLGLILLGGSCVPFGFAFTILSPLLSVGVRPTRGALVSSWSAGGITFQGWQVYAGGLLFALAALSMILGGVYFLLL